MDVEKNVYVNEVRPVSDSDCESGNDRHLPPPSWTPGFIERFPSLGVGAMFTVLLCSAMCVLVLELSDWRSQTKWPAKIAPNVIIGGLNNLANISLGIAIANGIAIAWWRQTLKGATIKELHRSWSFSASTKDLLLSGKHFNVIALAALTTKLAIIDSVLLQRATYTISDVDDPVTLKHVFGYINDTIPITNTLLGNGSDFGSLANYTVQDTNLWLQSGQQLATLFEGCSPGYCNLNLPGAGFAFDCAEVSQQIDYGMSAYNDGVAWAAYYEVAASSNYTATIPNVTTDYNMYTVDFELDFNTFNYSTINMTISWSEANDTGTAEHVTHSCPGVLHTRSCTMRPAVIEYPATFSNYGDDYSTPSISLGHDSNTDSWLYFIGINDEETLTSNSTNGYDETLKQEAGYTVSSYKNIYEDGTGNFSRLQGLMNIFQQYVEAGATISYNTTEGYVPSQSINALYWIETAPADSQQCGFTYKDPTNFIVHQINQLMFIISTDPSQVDPSNVIYTSNYSLYQSFEGQFYKTTIRYRTDRPFMWGAVASMFFCILCVMPSYYGYWQLGRKVTLGPFEIANAFRSPVLESEAANGEVKDLIKAVGNRPVQYGQITTGEQAGRLAVAPPEYVQRVHPSIHSAAIEINERLEQARAELNGKVEQVIGRNLNL